MVGSLNVSDLCDVAHALWVDRVADSDAFEKWLISEPTGDPEDLELRQALGLRGRGG